MNSRETERLFELLEDMVNTLHRIESAVTPAGSKKFVKFFTTDESGQKKEVTKMEVITGAAKRNLSVVFEDAQGNVAPVDGVPAWSITDATLGTITPAADGLSCLIAFSGKPGSGSVQLHANADMDPAGAVVDIVGSYGFQVVSGQATQVIITAVPA